MANELNYQVEKKIGEREVIRVNIRLSDECNNGFNEFAITGNIYKNNKFQMGGCIHEEILKHFPEFKIFVDLHLRDIKGVPMYPVVNGFYFLKNKEIYKLQQHLCCNDEELNIIKKATSEKEFAYLIHKCGIIKKWEEEAEKGIKELEKLTEKEFENNKDYRDKELLTIEEIKEFEEKDKNGYFSNEQVNKRIELQETEKREKRIKELEEEKRKEIEKIENEYKIYLHLAEITDCKNYIYYSHKNEVVFNWLNYNTISQEEFIDILNKIDYSKLPKDINITIKE
jgi:hypothetical protein